MAKIKIAIVDDHKILRDGIRLILSDQPDIDIVAEAANGKEFIERINDIDCDVVLMDISMPEMNGAETTKKALEIKPGLKILTLSMHNEEEYYYKMIHAGVKGFLLKDSKSNELKEAVLKVASGENYFSQELLRNIIFNLAEDKSQPKKVKLTFTNRESEVLKCICEGFSNFEIAERLHVSQRTVEGHRASLLKKTDSKNTANLIMFAIKNNLVEI